MRHFTDEEISELIDGLIVLNDNQREHLHQCGECSEKLAEYRKISTTLQDLPIVPISDEVSKKISQEVKTLTKFSQTNFIPVLTLNYKPILLYTVTISLFIIGVIIGYQYNTIFNKTDVLKTDKVTQVADNSELSSPQIEMIKAEEIPINEEDVLTSLSDEYIQTEYVGEELHSVTISDLVLSLADATGEFDISM
ncbi:MAG TPA: hypothetical protein PLT82_01445 [Candidatus Hydrogenedens sp.]|nr:hypothetical protein [Candidatus Hydrogenedens sp.]HOK08557.1 hypothetical protein [Candidatus Hydrogenedens sp.]HOL19045.1 hypothetical protein [Candidatus Hydrogenedens sp.]HPP57773.1 hypothetical protein [Candidatus Hydrogenedens sp.]